MGSKMGRWNEMKSKIHNIILLKHEFIVPDLLEHLDIWCKFQLACKAYTCSIIKLVCFLLVNLNKILNCLLRTLISFLKSKLQLRTSHLMLRYQTQTNTTSNGCSLPRKSNRPHVVTMRTWKRPNRKFSRISVS